MTKQEEIREGLMGILAISNVSVENKLKIALEYLHSQGVVIKVICPACSGTGDYFFGCKTCDSTGYIIEPLIKEE